MIYLIVPPIIIVVATAILIIFVSKLSSAHSDGGSFVLKKDKRGIRTRLSHGKEYIKSARDGAATRIKDTFTKKDNGGIAKKTESIVTEKNTNNIVSLRKKSMVSDKIENAQGRETEEIALMQEIENDPQNAKKYEMLGDYYMEHEQFSDARDCYKYVLRLDPRHKRAQVAMKNLDRVL
jgi:tetratricopeptide (TPR) repeat protein